jgi:flavorubredoxin/rubredoxin
MKKLVKNNVYWIGYLDWELDKFHGDDYSIFNGSSQNAYLIEEEKTVLMDTVWTPHRDEFVKNLESEIDLNKIDFIVAQHGECDHSGSLPALMKKIPNTPIYCTANAVKSIEGQYGKNGWDFHVVKTGDSIEIGNGKKLIFVEMPMLHWPDSLATFMTGDNILFSMDAFGQHYAVGELFNDYADQNLLWKEALKYYVNILNPFSPMVARKLKEIEAMNLPIEMIAPSHGAIWRKDPMQIVKKYAEWAEDVPEDRITIAYGTMWNGTETIAHAIADEIHKQSPKTVVKVYNVEKSDKNEIMVDVFRSKALCVGSPTVINDILAGVQGWMTFLKSLKFKNKKAAAFGCYGWSGEGVKLLQDRLKDAGFDVIEENVKSNWNPMEEDFAKIPALVSALIGSKEEKGEEAHMDKYQCPCGYVYDPAKGDPDNGVQPGTAWEDVPEDWTCPVCHLPKSAFFKVD